MAGESIKASDAKRVMDKISEMRVRWGSTTGEVIPFTVGKVITALDTNKLVDFILEGKSRSGWTGVVSPKVSVGQYIDRTWFDLWNQAEAIRVYCGCDCNFCACVGDVCPCVSDYPGCIDDNYCGNGCDGQI